MAKEVGELSENDKMRHEELNWVVAMIVSSKNHLQGGRDSKSLNPPFKDDFLVVVFLLAPWKLANLLLKIPRFKASIKVKSTCL